MRAVSIIAVASALTLAACGGGEGEAEEVVPMSEAEIEAELAETVMPLAGQYSATTELVDFSMAGVPDSLLDQGRAQFAESLAQGHRLLSVRGRPCRRLEELH